MKRPEPITEQQRKTLVAAALAARKRAHAKYSKFKVGAALLCDDGEIVTGCNVENVSYGLTICAERVAIQSAVAGGRQEFKALAVASAKAVTPCGACRQVMAEFCRDLWILLVDARKPSQVRTLQLADLLPDRFRLRD
ncbi:MAG: cytidine deaminase [Planctomycetia bacterium]|nr:cytidine deaminase [Planctomycetia bacterium]